MTPKKPEKKAPVEGEEDEDAEPEADEEEAVLKPQLQSNIYPDSVISMQATQLFLKRRAKTFKDSTEKHHKKWAIEGLNEKIEKYNTHNSMDLFTQASIDDENPLFPTTRFFQDNKTEVFEVDASGNKFEIFESMRIYCERFGRPFNYLKSVAFLNEQRELHLLDEETNAKQGSDMANNK